MKNLHDNLSRLFSLVVSIVFVSFLATATCLQVVGGIMRGFIPHLVSVTDQRFLTAISDACGPMSEASLQAGLRLLAGAGGVYLFVMLIESAMDARRHGKDAMKRALAIMREDRKPNPARAAAVRELMGGLE